MANDLDKWKDSPQETEGLLHSLRELILGARHRALRAVDAVQVQTCWEIGRHIVVVGVELGIALATRVRRLQPSLHAALLPGLPYS